MKRSLIALAVIAAFGLASQAQAAPADTSYTALDQGAVPQQDQVDRSRTRGGTRTGGAPGGSGRGRNN